ncbi:MAG: chloride channel protein [Clostridia bacterium]|nr:chloride channel protein [Clostridia bacterium]
MKKYDYIDYLSGSLPCILICALCGCVTGAVIFLFRYASRYIEDVSQYLYSVSKSSALRVIAVFAVAVLLALTMAYLHKKLPEVKGGGIPRSEGIMRGLLPFRALSTLIGTVIGSFISFFCGVPVGSEGPAVLIGTCLGGICTKKTKNRLAIDRYVMSGGAGAGFAVATGAPLSAMLFTLEEIHRRFTPMLVMAVSASIVCSTVVNRALCTLAGISPSLFGFSIKSDFELSHVGYLILGGIIIAVAVGIFDKSLALFKRFSRFASGVVSPTAKLIIIFVIVAAMGLFFNEGIYSGHHIIEEIIHEDKTLLFLLAIFALRLAMMLLVTDCGATGGIFIPTLAIGVLAGAVATELMIYLGFPSEYASATILLGMCAFLGGTLRAPFTACVLFAELTGSFTDFFYVSIAVFTVNIITEILAQESFYDTVLEHTVRKQNRNLCFETEYYTMTVSRKSFVCGKTVRDVMWPYFCVVLSVEHKTDYRDACFNDGEKRLHEGDIIKVRVRYTDKKAVLDRLSALVGNSDFIREEQ